VGKGGGVVGWGDEVEGIGWRVGRGRG